MPNALQNSMSVTALSEPASLVEFSTVGSVVFETIADGSRWEQLLGQSDRAHSVQAFGYGEAKGGKGWHVSRQLLSLQGRPVAIVQALEKRILGVRLVTRINRGPMFLIPDAPAHVAIAVYRAVRHRWGRFPFGILLIAPALEDRPENRLIMAKAGFKPRKGNGWGSARVDLDQPIDAVFQSFEQNWRRAIRAAERAGVTIQVVDGESDHEWMIERHLHSMVEKGFSSHDAEFLRGLRKGSGSDYVLLQAVHDGRPVAGLVMLKFAGVAEPIVGWFGDEGRQVKAGNAITWGAIQEMQRRGCRFYDVGGINSDKGFTSFKSGMNGAEYFLPGEYVGF